MTTESEPGCAQRENSEKVARNNPGSVLHTLRDLDVELPCEETWQKSTRQPPPAFLPAPPGKRPRYEIGTGLIDVHMLAQARRGDVLIPEAEIAQPPATPPAHPSARGQFSRLGPPLPAARVPEPSPKAASLAKEHTPSPLMLQVRGFVLGALCTGVLTVSLLARVATHSWPGTLIEGGSPSPSAARCP